MNITNHYLESNKSYVGNVPNTLLAETLGSSVVKLI